MTEDDLEILVMQYLDGSMPAAERALFDARLQNDPRAQELLRAHQALDHLLLDCWTMPAVNWPMLAERISSSIAQEETPARTYKIDFARFARRMAIAACLFIAGGVCVHLYMASRQRSNPLKVAIVNPQPRALPGHSPIDVAVAGIEPAGGTAIADVTIGPPANVAAGRSQIDMAEGVIYRSPRVIVASGAESAQDDTVQSLMD